MFCPPMWTTFSRPFTIGQVDTPVCSFHNLSFQNNIAYLEHQTLLSLVEHYIPKFARLNRKQKMEILLKGINPDDDKFTQLNTTLTKAVQNFIVSTKRMHLLKIKINTLLVIYIFCFCLVSCS